MKKGTFHGKVIIKGFDKKFSLWITVRFKMPFNTLPKLSELVCAMKMPQNNIVGDVWGGGGV